MTPSGEDEHNASAVILFRAQKMATVLGCGSSKGEILSRVGRTWLEVGGDGDEEWLEWVWHQTKQHLWTFSDLSVDHRLVIVLRPESKNIKLFKDGNTLSDD